MPAHSAAVLSSSAFSAAIERGCACSLLLNPEQMYQIVATLVRIVDGRVPVTVKMRTGFNDTALFSDNLLAIQSAGAAAVAVHPRTRRQGYTGRADWACTAHARRVLDIPVVRSDSLQTAPAALMARDDDIIISDSSHSKPLHP